MEGAQFLYLNVLLGLLVSSPQTTTSWPVSVPFYRLLAGKPWCSMKECGELHCGQRLWFITYSEPPLPCPLWDLTLLHIQHFPPPLEVGSAAQRRQPA